MGWFRDALGADIIDTDISETAAKFDQMIVWDFHDDNPDWAGQFDFVRTTSLEQALDPAKALAAWSRQLTPTGRIYIEHTMTHSAKAAGEMDPFGAHPMVMPYPFFTRGKGGYGMVDILKVPAKANNSQRAWVFVRMQGQSQSYRSSVALPRKIM